MVLILPWKWLKLKNKALCAGLAKADYFNFRIHKNNENNNDEGNNLLNQLFLQKWHGFAMIFA